MSKQKQQKTVISERTIEDFFMSDYYEYAKYTIANRAIPSIIDGLKPGARKILHAAFSVLSKDKEVKLFDIVGAAYSKSKYHHGDSSLFSTIMTMSSAYSNTLAPLEILGSGGTLRNTASAAPRYLDVKLSKWSVLFEKDKHILEYNYDGDDKVEPKFYLPLIPIVLTSRTTGIAIGYKYDAQVSYNPADLAEQCINILETGKISKKLTPHIEQYKGTFAQFDDKIKAIGRYTLQKDHIIVTELPPNQTFSKFENNLSKLLEEGKIQTWDNLSKDDDIKYKIVVNPTKLESQMKHKAYEKIYNLAEWLKRPTYTLLDENDKVIIFKTAEEVLRYFVEFRLNKYEQLKSVNIANLKERISEINNVLRFLDLYFDGTFKLGKEITMQYAKEQCATHKLPKSVLDIKMSKMTKEEYNKLKNELTELTGELELIQKTPIKELYLRELKEFHKEMKKSFQLQEFKVVR